MKVMPRSEYRWKAFKMRYLVPNWERAVGPAFWIYKAKMWWDYEMDTSNYCSKISHFIRWLNEDVKRWLTPWLRNARKFKHICIECNGTKLLEDDAMRFYIRTRDENQYYFLGRVNLIGKFTIIRRQWVKKDNTAINCFLYGVTKALKSIDENDEDEEEEQLTLKQEVIFTKYILTFSQLMKAIEEVQSKDEVGWDVSMISEEKLIFQLRPKDPWKFKRALEKDIFEKYFPYTTELSKLHSEDFGEFDKKVSEIDLETAKKILKNMKD